MLSNRTECSIATNYNVAELVLNLPHIQSPMFIDEFNLESSTDIIKSYLVDGGSTWRKPYPRLSKYKYNGANDSQAFEKHIRIDPLLGVENSFDYPNYCVASLNNHLESRVFYLYHQFVSVKWGKEYRQLVIQVSKITVLRQ